MVSCYFCSPECKLLEIQQQMLFLTFPRLLMVNLNKLREIIFNLVKSFATLVHEPSYQGFRLSTNPKPTELVASDACQLLCVLPVKPLQPVGLEESTMLQLQVLNQRIGGSTTKICKKISYLCDLCKVTFLGSM